MKKLLLILMLILLSSLVSASRTLIVSDDFNRVNSNDLGTSSDGNVYYIEDGDFVDINRIRDNENKGIQDHTGQEECAIYNLINPPHYFDASGKGINLTLTVTDIEYYLTFRFADVNASCSGRDTIGVGVDGLNVQLNRDAPFPRLRAFNGTTQSGDIVTGSQPGTGEYSIIVNLTHIVMIVNGVEEWNVEWTGMTTADFSSGVYIYQGRAAWNNQFPTDFDNLLIYVESELVEGIPETPIIQPPSPEDNANNNINVTLNVSHSSGLNDVQYYLYFGSDNPLTEDNLYLTNVTRTGDEHRSFVTNISVNQIYYLKWRVQNITNGLFSANTTQRTWTLDTVTPTISLGLNGDNNFSIDNTTIISNYLANLSIDISFFDINLFQTLINITNSMDESVYSKLNTSITGTTVNVSEVVDISGLTIGNYTIKLIATDPHSANSIEPYKIKTGLNYFRYTTEEGNIIWIRSNNINLFTKSTTKLKDRYNFEFNFLIQQNTYTFTIESYNKINYIEDSDYNAHFVIIGENGRGNWIDFNAEGLNKKDYKVTKIDDYTYEVEITANGLKSFTFNSIGGLNTIEDHYKFRIGAAIDVWVYDEENYPKQINTTATIGVQSANSTENVSGARLINVTQETTVLTLTSSGFGIEDKTISITQSYHNFSFNMSPVSAAKLYFYDEKSEELITGETFSVYLETTGFSNTYSGITDNPYSIIGLQNGLYKLKTSSTNYLEREYLDLNISNTTTTILNIYLTNSSLGSEITFNIVSADGLAPLEDVRTVFTKIIDGTSTVIAEEESDYAGQIVVALDSNTQYTINFSKTDYEDKEITLEPKNSEYLIQMVSTVGAYNQSVHEGIRYRFEPSNMILNNNTNYNFTFTLNSTVWGVTNCTLRLFNGTILLTETSSYTSSSCHISIERNTASMTTITSEAIYELVDLYEFTVSQQYSIIYTYEGQFSLKNFLDDLSDFSMAGFDSFGRMILAFIVIFIILTMASMKISFEHKEVPLFIFWALVGFFSYVNWFYLDLGTMPDILGLKKWFIFYLVSLICGGFMINKFRT